MASRSQTNHVAGVENPFARLNKQKLLGSKIPRRSALGEVGNQVGFTKISGKNENSTKNKVLPYSEVNHPLPFIFEKNTDKQVSEINGIVENPEIISKLSISSKPRWFPAQVEDADKDDEENLFLVSIYVNDIYHYLRKLEDKYPIPKMYLTGREISDKMRAVLIDWLFEVQDQFGMVQESLHRAVAIIDLYLMVANNVSKGNLQLVGVCALLIASKYEDMYPPGVSELVYITDSSYTKEEILEMERNILKTISFELGRPISINFLRRYSKVAKVQPIHHTYAKYFLDLALVEYSLCHVKPSMIAAVATYVANCVVSSSKKSKLLFGPKMWSPTLKHYSTYDYSDFCHLIPILVKVIKKSHSLKLQAVRVKYSTSQQSRVSLEKAVSANSEILNLLSSLDIPKN